MRALLPLLPAVDADRAAAIARAECEARGWGWIEPVCRSAGLRHYRFWTNAGARGANAEIIVRADSAAVTRAWIGPR
jgi:hypothetical protein